jgi:hypothetical protein
MKRINYCSSAISASIWAWVFLGVIVFGFTIIFYANVSVVDIVLSFVAYQLVFAVLLWCFIFECKIKLPKFSPRIFISALVITFFAIYGLSSYTESLSDIFISIFPLARLDYGIKWFYLDTAYHVALVRSIADNGYPSISLHGKPLTQYHVLTHYLDAVVANITSFDVFDSYPMVIIIKSYLYISAVLIFFAKIVERYGLISVVLIIGLGLPVALNTWHAVMSHGIWLPTLILTFAMPFLIQIMYKQQEMPSWPQVLALVALSIVVGLGKVSSGFMLACLLGCWLLAKSFFSSKLKAIAFGGLTILFFFIYGQLFIGQGYDVGFSTDGFDVYKLLKFYSGEPALGPFGGATMAPYVAAFLGLFAIHSMIFRKPATFQLASATAGAMLVTWVVTTIHKGLSPYDVWYFVYGLYVPLVFIGSVVITDIFISLRAEWLTSAPRRVVAVLMGVSIVFFVAHLNTSKYTLFNLTESAPKLADVTSRLMKPINTLLSPDHQLNLLDSRFTKREKLSFLSGSFTIFGNNLKQRLQEQGVSAQDSALFLSRKIFDNELDQRLSKHAPSYSYGILIYALWGVPLVHGAPELSPGYGLATYANFGKIINRDQFDLDYACKVSGAKVVWDVISLSPPKINPNNCSNHK